MDEPVIPWLTPALGGWIRGQPPRSAEELPTFPYPLPCGPMSGPQRPSGGARPPFRSCCPMPWLERQGPKDQVRLPGSPGNSPTTIWTRRQCSGFVASVRDTKRKASHPPSSRRDRVDHAGVALKQDLPGNPLGPQLPHVNLDGELGWAWVACDSDADRDVETVVNRRDLTVHLGMTPKPRAGPQTGTANPGRAAAE